MKIQINCRVEDGKIITNRKALNKAIGEFENKNITITIERKKKTRSTPQNAYYWSVIIPIIQNGIKDNWNERHSTKEIHEFLKRELNYNELVNKVTGEIKKIGKSTTECTTVEFEEYLEDCRRFCSDFLNIEIPLPNEQMSFKID